MSLSIKIYKMQLLKFSHFFYSKKNCFIFFLSDSRKTFFRPHMSDIKVAIKFPLAPRRNSFCYLIIFSHFSSSTLLNWLSIHACNRFVSTAINRVHSKSTKECLMNDIKNQDEESSLCILLAYSCSAVE